MESGERVVYQVAGGTLPLGAKTYVERDADKQLLEFAKSMAGTNRVFCIFAPRQYGKSSLMVRVAHQLMNEGLICVQLNLQGLGGVNSENSLLYNILEHICLEIEKPIGEISLSAKLEKAWEENTHRLPTRRFQKFLTEEVLRAIAPQKLILFIDEIQNVIVWNLQDNFIGLLKELTDDRQDPFLQRLNVVILGVTKPSDLSKKPSSVLNLGEQIDLGRLTGTCQPLWKGLTTITKTPEMAMQAILGLTGGQPFLTQLACHLVVQHLRGDRQTISLQEEITAIVYDRLIKDAKAQNHFQDIKKRFDAVGEETKDLEIDNSLVLYETITNGTAIKFDPGKNEHWELLISGLLTKDDDRILKPANRIYEQVFNEGWIRSTREALNLEKNNTRPVIIQPHIRSQVMSRAEQIDSIIQQRQPLVERIELVEENLQTLATGINALEKCRIHLIRDATDPEIGDRLQALDFSPILSKVSQNRIELETLRKRLSRNTLNIGVVGLMGQGKSTLLQKIGGLTEEIPARRGGACTAVRSTIYHYEGETYARVKLHTEQSFLEEVIRPYYQALDLGETPRTLDDFAQTLPPFLGTDATKKSMYEYLKNDYHKNLFQYRSLLTSGTPRELSSISKGEIHKYVSQQRETFDYLAVQEVEIFCRFQNPEVGKIALVDVPGLGDTKPIDEKLMRETLEQTVDLVLFVRRPDPLRYAWEQKDTDLYDKAAKALNNLEKRSFMVLNRLTGNDDNLEACQEHQATIGEKHINVVDCEIADCSNSEEANRVLDAVLAYLINNITELDKQYARLYQERLYQLQRDVNGELEKARQDWANHLSPDDEYRIYRRLFKQLWESLTVGFNQLRKELMDKRDVEDQDFFKPKVEAAIANCKDDPGIPSLEEVEVRQLAEGGYGIVYEKYLNEIRTHLTGKFQGLNEAVRDRIDIEKTSVTDVLVERGCLTKITPVRGPEFLKIIAEDLLDNNSKLKKPFQNLYNFELSSQINVYDRIQPHLDNLNPNKTRFRLGKNPSAKEVLAYLEANQSEAVFKCEEALTSLSVEPRKAAFAAIDEFIDRILRGEDMKDEWDIFFYNARSQVWQSEFGRDSDSQTQQDWLQLVERVAAANQQRLMQFLN